MKEKKTLHYKSRFCQAVSGQRTSGHPITVINWFKVKFLILFQFVILGYTVSAQNFEIVKFGAKGDGVTMNTKAIQLAIDQCAQNGGGQVYFAPGKYLSGTIFMKSNVVLFLEAGSELLGSTLLKDFPVTNPAFLSFTNLNYTDKSLIYAEKVNNIGIIGKGTINGQGEAKAFQLTGAVENYKERPFIIRMIECNNITIRDITLKNSPMWVQHYLACENLNIDGITVSSKVNVNNDGLDIDACRFVRISNCNINSGDDCIVLKSSAPRLCEQVVITNCILSSGTNAFKLGTESTGGFRDILVNNCTMYDTFLGGINLETVDGGILEGIIISNITMRNVNNCIFIRLGNRGRPFNSKQIGKPTESFFISDSNEKQVAGVLNDVIIKNIIATGLDGYGSSITGLSGHKVENIILSDISMSFKGGGKKDFSTRKIEENIQKYPEYDMFGILPSYGFYIRHAKDVFFSNIHLEYENPEFRPAIYAEDIEGLSLQGMFLKAPSDGSESVKLKDVIKY